MRARKGNCRRLVRLWASENYATHGPLPRPWPSTSSRPTGSFPCSARGAQNQPMTRETLTLKNSDN